MHNGLKGNLLSNGKKTSVDCACTEERGGGRNPSLFLEHPSAVKENQDSQKENRMRKRKINRRKDNRENDNRPGHNHRNPPVAATVGSYSKIRLTKVVGSLVRCRSERRVAKAETVILSRCVASCSAVEIVIRLVGACSRLLTADVPHSILGPVCIGEGAFLDAVAVLVFHHLKFVLPEKWSEGRTPTKVPIDGRLPGVVKRIPASRRTTHLLVHVPEDLIDLHSAKDVAEQTVGLLLGDVLVAHIGPAEGVRWATAVVVVTAAAAAGLIRAGRARAAIGPHCVVVLSFGLIAYHAVRLGNRLKLFFCIGSFIAVRVELQGKFFIRCFDLVLRCGGRYTKRLIKILRGALKSQWSGQQPRSPAERGECRTAGKSCEQSHTWFFWKTFFCKIFSQ